MRWCCVTLMDEPGVPEDPRKTLDHIREKMQRVATDFSEGRINRAQFNAIYAHYSEQQSIIERLIERNPENQAWRQVAQPGHTSFLRTHFEAHPLYYVVFRHHTPRPLITSGEQPAGIKTPIVRILKSLWSLPEIPPGGLARKPLPDDRWLIIATGELAVTIVLYSLQPSTAQNHRVRDIHADFERANRISLQRKVSPSKMVFPQRALLSQ